MTDTPQAPPRRKIFRTAVFVCAGIALLIALTGPMILVLMALFAFVVAVAILSGPWETGIACAVSLVILTTAQLHWMRGNTVCLANPDYPYLWTMQRTDPNNASGSIDTEGGSISISFSVRSTDMIPGARYAQVFAGEGATLTRLSLDGARSTQKDTFIGMPFTPPQDLTGTAFYVPQSAQFRASLPFETVDRTAAFSVLDLPVLAEVEEGRFTPLGVLRGEVTLGDTAILKPARFGGRNVLLDGHRAGTTRSDEAYYAEKALNPLIVVDRLQTDWLLLRRPSQLRLNRYAAAYGCRPAAYEAWGIGALFVPWTRAG